MSILDERAGVLDSAAAWAALRIGGSDARAFLQGQLSNDLSELAPHHSLLASLNTPQGRVTAVLRLIERSDGIVALLPDSMIATVIERLRKYVLRSKVTLAPAEDLSVVPLVGITPGELAAVSRPAEVGCVHFAGPTARTLAVGAASQVSELLAHAGLTAADWNTWRLAQIEAGEPQVYPQTSEHFVAQMLNLDLVGGLSFSKGCYTGQEIIVRTQHLGRIKRRMIRAHHAGDLVAPGVKLFEGDASAGEIVEVARRSDGTMELLAVIALTHAPGAVHVAGCGPLKELTLPYALSIPTSP